MPLARSPVSQAPRTSPQRQPTANTQTQHRNAPSTPTAGDRPQTRTPPRYQIDQPFIATGHQLLAFSQTTSHALRNVTEGRQSLQCFSRQYPLLANTQFPVEWNTRTNLATAALTAWLSTPDNPFVPIGMRETTELPQERRPTASEVPYRDQNLSSATSNPGVKQAISDLKSIIERQNEKLAQMKTNVELVLRQNTALKAQNEEIRAQNEEIKAHNEIIKNQIEETKAQYTKLGTTLTAMMGKLEQLTSTPANTPSWANTAALRTSTTPPARLGSDTNTIVPPMQSQARPPGVDVDLSGLTNPLFDTTNPKAIRDRVRQAFDSHQFTKEIGWVGIAKKGVDHLKFRVCLRTHEEAATVRIHNEWLSSHFSGSAHTRGPMVPG